MKLPKISKTEAVIGAVISINCLATLMVFAPFWSFCVATLLAVYVFWRLCVG